jgi:probable F420-dependent oxidoreductase
VVTLKIGLLIFPTERPVDIAVTAGRAEALGYDSLWVGEHPIMPVESESAFPSGGPIPPSYSWFLDPFVTLGRASGVTSTLKLGTGIILVPERNPLLLAKEIATLDQLSQGRFQFGIGAGWNREETEILGGDFDHRWTQTREAVYALKEIWANGEAEHHGQYYDFPPIRSFPKPVQKPHPPIFLGGAAMNVYRRTVEYGDGWIPTRNSPEQIKEGRDALTELANRAGRDPQSIQVVAYGVSPDVDRETLKAYEEAGADSVVVRFTAEPEDAAVAELERIAHRLID